MLRPLTFLSGLALVGLGGSLVARAITGGYRHAPGERNAGASVAYGRGARIDKTVTIAREVEELYGFWRDLANLPDIMSHLVDVTEIDPRRSHWVARGPKGYTAEWEAEIIDDTPGERIAWRSVSGSVANAGSVRFRRTPDGRGTELHLEMEWAPPAGILGASFVHLFGGDPALIVERDLLRFKTFMETGEFAVNGTIVNP